MNPDPALFHTETQRWKLSTQGAETMVSGPEPPPGEGVTVMSCAAFDELQARHDELLAWQNEACDLLRRILP